MSVTEFDSLEDMFAVMAEESQQLKAASEEMFEWGAKATPGKWYLSISSEMPVILGEILDADAEFNPEEDMPTPKHLRLVRAASAWCPDGELGFTPFLNIHVLLSAKLGAALQQLLGTHADLPAAAMRSILQKHIGEWEMQPGLSDISQAN
jgi:hypothetical protein